jgi:hypothetical protein
MLTAAAVCFVRIRATRFIAGTTMFFAARIIERCAELDMRGIRS